MKSYGHRLLEIVKYKSWNELCQLDVACRDLRHHCVLCGTYQGRPQELNAHLRTCHGNLLQFVFTKAAQITKAQASHSPCRFCQRDFKQQHMCPVLLINLFAERPDQIPELVRTCESCGQGFPDLATLHGHLTADHKVPLQDWRPERDLFGTDPVCAHCRSCFTSKAAVRQHVTQGQCPAFDPEKLR